MKSLYTIILILLAVLANFSLGQTEPPKSEFRGAWVATVINLDWPSSPFLTTNAQKEELIQLFNKLEETNINSVIFQIRSECDAMYASNYDPWSYWLTGSQGTAPSPYYDPLEFAIEEAHARGLELHAWFNPYRAEREVNGYTTSGTHVTNLHPSWVIRIGNIKFLNPGLPEVREYVTNVIMDVVHRYDIDGVHFDDYFYPYPPDEISNEDSKTFQDYPRGFSNIGDWRRDNVNELLRMISDSINAVKPEIKFGMSPFGIYKNGVPSGITGLDAYSSIYCDPIAWLQEKIIDYLAPQLYWPFGGGQDYGKLLPWWASRVDERHLYPGQALYRAGSFPANEIPRQIKLNRETENCQGSILFRAQNLFGNPNGVTDSLNNNYYKYKAISPSMSWKDLIIPNNPSNLRFESLAEIRGLGIQWDDPVAAVDEDIAEKFIIYQFDNNAPTIDDFNDPKNIWKITANNFTTLNASERIDDIMYFAVTSLDDNSNESSASNVISVQVQIPDIPVALGPENNSQNQRDTTLLFWNNSIGSSSNRLQLSLAENFDSIYFEQGNIIDTFKIVSNLEGLTKFYWRVSAQNIAGESEYSTVQNFTTGFPKAPLPLFPEDKTLEIPVIATLDWAQSPVTNSYQVQISEGLSIEPSLTVLDTVLSDTTITTPLLKTNQIYSWRVKGENEFGQSKWSETYKFKTQIISKVDDIDIVSNFSLGQNYPNPFNPETTISFTLPESGYTSLKIYDVLGREIKIVKDQYLSSGKYTLKFNGNNLASGVYIYVLQQGKYIDKKKMLLLK